MFHDVESGREIYVDPTSARHDYLRRFSAHAARNRAVVRRPGHRVRVDHDRPAAGAGALRPLEGENAPRPPAGPPDRAGTRRCAMSFLAPLYVLGLAAVAAPIVFHLIRRSPRGEVPFSSLMFLSPTPPRLTRRSRLDHWLLLLLAGGRALPAGVCVRPAVPAPGGPARLRRRGAAPDRPLDRHQREHAPRRPVAAGAGTGPASARRLPAHRSTGGVCLRSRRPGRCSASTNRRRSTRRSAKRSPGQPSIAWRPAGPAPTWDRPWSTPSPRSKTWPTRARKSARCRAGSS